MKLEELLINQLSKEQVLDLFINGMIDRKRNLITEYTFSRLIHHFMNTFTSEELEELFKIDKSLPSFKEILKGKVNPKPVLVDGTNK